jgi:hypothetical protein
VPCRIPRAEDVGGTNLGGEAIGVDCASENEVSYYSIKDEEITEAACSSTADHFHP